MTAIRNAVRTCAIAVFVGWIFICSGNSSVAQQIRVSQPLTRVSDSSFERMGVNFGFFLRGGTGPGSRVVGLSPTGQIQPNIVFSQNGVSSAVPQFGDFDPNTQGYTGFGAFGDNGGFTMQLFGGQGSTRSNVSQTPSVVVQNGQLGSIFSGQIRPFVTGIVPVLGGQGFGPQLVPPPMVMGNGFRSDGIPSEPSTKPKTSDTPKSYSDPQSTALRGDISVDEIRRQRNMKTANRSTKLKAEIEELVKNADDMVKNGKRGAARAKYARAIRKIGENSELSELRESITVKLNAIQKRR